MAWTSSILTLYLAVLALLSLNGLHRLWMIGAFLRYRPEAMDPLEVWPPVTVQLPLFNEQHVVERVIRAAGALRYPRDRLSIQVLDDSTDATTAIARRVVQELVDQGIDAVLLHRDDRVGFKAGALAEGLRQAKGTHIAVFDADFVPGPDFLERVMPHFGPGVGMVQARWGHLNAGASWLTAAQATLLDGHFVVEHTARHASGRWFNFNGTAGVWRREAIEDAGGWQHDTLTEDLDLSYRAQLAGWQFRYLPEVVVPAELPATMAAFKAQQHRWAKGSIQTAVKLLGTLWRSDAPWPNKLEATVHLTANLNYPLVLLLTVMLPVAVVARLQGADAVLLAVDGGLFLVAVVPFFVFYAVAIAYAGHGCRWRRTLALPLVLALGLGMAVAQSRAVFEGLFGEVGTFVRTPKAGDGAASVYRAAGRGGAVELALAAYLSVALAYVIAERAYASVPFLGLFTAGYGLVGLSSLRRA